MPLLEGYHELVKALGKANQIINNVSFVESF